MMLVLLISMSILISVAILETDHSEGAAAAADLVQLLPVVQMPNQQQERRLRPVSSFNDPQPEHFRHRRLHQEREGDAARGGGIDEQQQQQHVTSYAQRHQNYYSSGGNSNNNGNTNSNNAYGASSYYNYDDDYSSGASKRNNGVHRRYPHNYYDRSNSSEFYTDLSDVWLCLLIALAWTVWMISSFVASKQAAAASYNCYYNADGNDHAVSMSARDRARFLQYYDPDKKRDTVLLVRGHVREVSRTDF